MTLNSLVPGNVRHATSNTSHSSILNYVFYDGVKHQHKVKKPLLQIKTPFTQSLFLQFQMTAYVGHGILIVIPLSEHPDCAIKSQPLVKKPPAPSHSCKTQRLNHVLPHLASQRKQW